MAPAAYLGGPITGEYLETMRLKSALFFLIVETHNDHVRFHGESRQPNVA